MHRSGCFREHALREGCWRCSQSGFGAYFLFNPTGDSAGTGIGENRVVRGYRTGRSEAEPGVQVIRGAQLSVRSDQDGRVFF
jgi:hypothetical protein